MVQCGLTVALLACSFFLGVQIYRLLHEPLGYTYGNVLCYPNMSETNNLYRFRDEVRKLPFVKNVSLTRGMPVDGGNGHSTTYNLKGRIVPVDFRLLQTDSAFLDIFHIPLERDYHLTYSDRNYYLNHEAFRQMGLDDDAVSFKIEGEDASRTIAGRFPDFRMYSALDPIRPVLMQIIPSDSIGYPWDILVETTDGDLPAYKHQLDALYSEIIEGVPFESHWYDYWIADAYAEIIRMNKVIGIFTLAALLISLLGLTAMSLYFIAQRKRDMAIRKVFGSDNQHELLRLLAFAGQSLAASLLIAVPIIGIGFRYIQRIVGYDKSFPWWTACVAFIAVAAISLLSIGLISRSATRENPINNIKTE